MRVERIKQTFQKNDFEACINAVDIDYESAAAIFNGYMHKLKNTSIQLS